MSKLRCKAYLTMPLDGWLVHWVILRNSFTLQRANWQQQMENQLTRLVVTRKEALERLGPFQKLVHASHNQSCYGCPSTRHRLASWVLRKAKTSRLQYPRYPFGNLNITILFIPKRFLNIGAFIFTYADDQHHLMSTDTASNHVASLQLPSQNVDASYQPNCAACGGPILDRYLLKVCDSLWHEHCLTCSICDTLLAQAPSCYVRDGKIFCKLDYKR